MMPGLRNVFIAEIISSGPAAYPPLPACHECDFERSLTTIVKAVILSFKDARYMPNPIGRQSFHNSSEIIYIFS